MGSAGQTDGAGGVSSDASPRLRVAIVSVLFLLSFACLVDIHLISAEAE